MICGLGGSKSRLGEAVGAEPSGWMRNEEWHATVARSKFPSLPVHFWKLGCGKFAHRCGANSTGKEIDGLAPLLEVWMSKKCTPLCREAHFEVKMHKTQAVGAPLEAVSQLVS